MAIPHNSKCRYGERGAADAKPKAQIILDAAKVSAASGGNSEPKQGQRSQSARGFCPRSTMRVPHPDIIEHFGNADAVPQPPKRCLSRKAGIVRCCLRLKMTYIEFCLKRFACGDTTMCFRLYQESFPGNKPTVFPTNTSRGKHPGPRCQQWDEYPYFPEYPAAARWNAVVLLPTGPGRST